MERDEQSKSAAMHCALTIRIAKDSIFFGPGPCRLMQSIAETGSLEAAARQMEMSYSKARRIIKQIEKELGIPVVIRHSGGLNGGSSTLTKEGERFIASYTQFARLLRQSADELFHTCF